MNCFKLIPFLLASLAVLASTPSSGQEARPRSGDLKPGDAAPDFTVPDIQGKNKVSLASLKGKPVVLFFGSCT